MSSNFLRQVFVSLALAVFPRALTVSASQGQTAVEASTVSGPRVLHFPTDRSLGRLMIRSAYPEQPVENFYYWLRDSDWDVLGPARGPVTVPAACQVLLSVDARQSGRDLSPLAQLAPDDLYALTIHGSYPGGGRPDDVCMAQVAHLTGLRILGLTNTNVTAAGMKQIVALKNLRYLTVPDGLLDDAGMAYVGQLPSLIGLYLKQNRVTNAGLQHLAQLRSLAELELGGGQINDDGLAYLAELPQLRYLILWGKGFTDVGLGRLRNVKSLEILNLGVLEQITDAGLAQLSSVPQLRDISLCWCKNITNAGLVPLKKLPDLRRLDISHSQVTDEGLAHLRESKTLEGLMLPDKGITDRGLTYLSELPRLRELQVVRAVYGDPRRDKNYYTDGGLQALSSCTQLRDLAIGSLGITDEGTRHLAKLTHLTKLTLIGCRRITNESLRTIAQLPGLEALTIRQSDMSISGLKSLNNLTCLKMVHLDDIAQDNSGLDLSGLVNLEDLTLILQSKRVGGTVVPEALQERDMAAFRKLTHLRRLQISPAGATNASLEYLTALSRLDQLSLGGNGLTDEGLAHLSSLSRLTSLTLSGRFTDKALTYLQKLPELNHLEFRSGARFSPAAVSEFRRKVPTLTVFRGYETDRGPGTGPTAGGRRR